MCGIVGMVASAQNGFTYSQKKVFTSLLWADTLRGDDSTGVFGVNKHGNVDYLKTTGGADKLLRSTDYAEFDRDIFSDYHMVVGHNRKATKGWATEENAHPFVEGDIVLVHNGTITNQTELTKELCTVDSHAILHSIVEKGYKKTLEEIQGAFTLVWYNAKEKTLYAIRNAERPLFIANTIGAWYFASEEDMLEWILGREGIQIKEMTCCKPGTLYTFKLDDKENMYYEPAKLWKPKKIIPESPKSTEKQTQLPKKEPDPLQIAGLYSSSDFPCGTRILIQGDRVVNLPEKSRDGFASLIFGDWYFDPEIKVKVWATEEETTLLDVDYDVEEQILFSAEIMVVMTKNGKITLICRNIKKYIPSLDSKQNEIYEDEFIFTNHCCSYCNKPMTFEDAKKGILDYKSETDFVLVCENCLDKHS